MRRRARDTKRKPIMNKRTRKYRKKLRGGTTTPFSELGNIFSGITNSLQSFAGSFSVIPSAYNPPNNPDVSKQFLSPPATQTMNQIYKSSFSI